MYAKYAYDKIDLSKNNSIIIVSGGAPKMAENSNETETDAFVFHKSSSAMIYIFRAQA